MTVEEYLSQSKQIDMKIELAKEQLEEYKELSCSARSPQFDNTGTGTSSSYSTNANFVGLLHTIDELEEKICQKIEQMVKLKIQIINLIYTLEDQDEIHILKMVYLKNSSFSKLAEELYVDESTVRRWHKNALSKLVLPEDAIDLKSL